MKDLRKQFEEKSRQDHLDNGMFLIQPSDKSYIEWLEKRQTVNSEILEALVEIYNLSNELDHPQFEGANRKAKSIIEKAKSLIF